MALPNGTYTFTNKAFPNSKLDLLNSDMSAAITGLTVGVQRWKVTNVANGQVTIQHWVNNSYVSACEEVRSIGLKGSIREHKWVAIPVPREDNTYCFKTTGETRLFWTLMSGGEYAVVALMPESNPIPNQAKWVLS